MIKLVGTYKLQGEAKPIDHSRLLEYIEKKHEEDFHMLTIKQMYDGITGEIMYYVWKEIEIDCTP